MKFFCIIFLFVANVNADILTAGKVAPEVDTNSVAKRSVGFNAARKITSKDGPLDMLLFGAAANGSTDDTSIFTTAKALAGTNGVVYFPAKSTGSVTIYYFAGTLDLTGCKIVADPGVVLSVGNSLGIDYRSILTASDVVITNRAKVKQYVLAKNQGDFARFRSNVPRESYTSLTHLTFTGDFTAGQMGFASATPASPGVAFTTTTNASTIETAVVATTNYLGHWIRPKVGQTIEMVFSTVASQSSGHAQAVILDSTGTEYCGVEAIDFDNGLKSQTYEANLVRMTGGTRSRTTRKAVRDRNYMLGHNGTTGASVLVGVKMISPTTAQFFLNHILMGTMTLNSGNNADRIFFAMNGAYSGGVNGFYNPVAYEDKLEAEQKDLSIAVFGDSVAAGSHTTVPWPELLPQFLEGQEGIGKVRVTNYGVSGATSGDMVTSMSGVTLSAFTDVIVAVGINDIVGNVTSSAFEANMDYLVRTPQAAGVNSVVSMAPMFSGASSYDVRGGLIRGITQRVAATRSARVADNLTWIGDQIDDYNVGDLVHPFIDGNVIHAQAVAAEIIKNYKSAQPQVFQNIRRVNGSLVMQGTAPPTTGYFRVGDKIENSAPSAGGFIGWVCVTAGSPGTWKTFGAIAP